MKKTTIRTGVRAREGIDCSDKSLLAECREEIVRRTVELLAYDEADGMRWTGSMADLMEMADTVWRDGRVRDNYGCPQTMVWIARRLCTVLHARLPANPYAKASAAKWRKGVRRHTYAERYCWLRHVAGRRDPISEEIRITKTTHK